MNDAPAKPAPLLRRILVTNDDGIDAPGLTIAEEVAAQLAAEVWTVAPVDDYSGGSRRISVHSPLRLHPAGERRYGLTGSPADCVFVGLGAVLEELGADLVISGVNAGVNIGSDVGFSGTIGAAMTARALGTPAVALSQAWRGKRSDIRWETARRWLPDVVGRLLGAPDWPTAFVPNINIPAVGPEEITGITVTRQGSSARVIPTVEKRVDLRSLDYYWIYMHKENNDPAPDEDIAALRRNEISITPFGFDITDRAGMESLAQVF